MVARKQGLLTAQQAIPQTRQEIKALVALCKQHEKIDLPLLLDPTPTPENDDNLYFLYYHQDALVGAASTWPGREIEVVGAVHPSHRRQGIGRALVDALILEGRQRGADSLLLICEPGAPSGPAFARAVNAQYEFGEYRLELDRARYAQRPEPLHTLDLERAGAADQETLVDLLATQEDVDPHRARERIADWQNDANQGLYIGWLENHAAGMIRVHRGASSAYLYTFLVHPSLRKRGYGRQILTHILDLLVTEDWPHIRLEVDTENEIALALYRSVGFCKIATYQYYRLAIEPL